MNKPTIPQSKVLAYVTALKAAANSRSLQSIFEKHISLFINARKEGTTWSVIATTINLALDKKDRQVSPDGLATMHSRAKRRLNSEAPPPADGVSKSDEKFDGKTSVYGEEQKPSQVDPRHEKPSGPTLNASTQYHRKEFHSNLRPHLKAMRLSGEYYYSELEAVAWSYVARRRQFRTAGSDSKLLSDLQMAIERSDEKLPLNILTWSSTLVAAVCGEFPGHGFEVADLASNQLLGFFDLESGALSNEAIDNALSNPNWAGNLVSVKKIRSTDMLLPPTLDKAKARHFLETLITEACQPDVWIMAQWEFLSAFVSSMHLVTPGKRLVVDYDLGAPRQARDNLLSFAALMLQTLLEPPSGSPDLLKSQDYLRWAVSTVLSETFRAAPLRAVAKTLSTICACDPAAFRQGLVQLQGRIRDQYGGEGDKHGKARNISRWHAAEPRWQLIDEVLDVIWSPEKGPLGDAARRNVFNDAEGVIVCVHEFGKALLEVCFGYAENPKHPEAINPEHIERVARLRAQIFLLNDILRKLDQKLFEPIAPRSTSNSDEKSTAHSAPSDDDYELTVVAVRRWRKELERILRQGDHERGKRADKKRPSGPNLKLPKFEKSWWHLSFEEQVRIISRVALDHNF